MSAWVFIYMQYDLKYVILAMLKYSAVSKQCFWTSLFWPWKEYENILLK